MKRLYRSKKNRLIAGVFGGIAEYFGVSATLLRIIIIILALLFGLPEVIVVILLYIIIAYVIIPEEP